MSGLSYNINIRDIPLSTGAVIGIPRQQIVCLSGAGQIIIDWAGRYIYKSIDSGENWGSQLDLETIYDTHEHLWVRDDTIWAIGPYAPSNYGQVCRISSTPALLYKDNISILTASEEPVFSMALESSGNNAIAITRYSGHYSEWRQSTDLGRTWGDWQPALHDLSGSSGRLGLIPKDNTFFAFLFNADNGEIWNYTTGTPGSFAKEGTENFFDATTQRSCCAIYAKGKYWVSYINSAVSTINVSSKTAGIAGITYDNLWAGTGFYNADPEFVGYTALSSITALESGDPIIFYIHPDSGSDYTQSKLFMRVYWNGAWQPEQKISDVTGVTNLTTPFIIPSGHGKVAYCLFKDSGTYGHVAVVNITEPTSAKGSIHMIY